MPENIRVAILDDHQSIIDGYMLRFSSCPNIEIIDYVSFGVDLEPMLEDQAIDMLILDIHVLNSEEDKTVYPVLETIPRLLQIHPDLNILVISMYNQPSLIEAVLNSGASGYILKDDYVAIQSLGEIVDTVAKGGIYLSQRAYDQLYRKITPDDFLSPRQLEILTLSAAHPAASSAEMADIMGIANSTARNLLARAYVRLGVHRRAEALSKARHLGLLPAQEALPEHQLL